MATPKPERLGAERTRVLSTLDARGEYALITYQREDDTAPRIAITRWRAGERCDVPVWGEPVAAPLARAPRERRGPAFYVPLAVPTDAGAALMLVDDRCRMYGPFGEIAPDTARTVVSPRDARGYLLFRDEGAELSVLDPARDLTVRSLARGVEAMRASLELGGEERDVVWIAAGGELSLRTLTGELLLRMGSDVHGLTLARDGTRVAFIDGDALYEAVAPRFRASQVTEGGCAPRYGRDTLEFFVPCEPPQLRRVELARGRYQEFEEGVFASEEQEGVQLDYRMNGAGEAQLYARYPSGEHVRVEPTFDRGKLYVLDDQRIAGLDGEGRFGVWQRNARRFSALLSEVAEVVPHHRGKKHRYSWLIYHDVRDELGTLTLLHDDGARVEIARSVPLSSHQGYTVEGGGSLTPYPFTTPVVVLLADARPADDPPARFCGRLKALSITGEPRADLAEHVCSYVMVAAPVPGVLFGVEEGPERGFWFVAL